MINIRLLAYATCTSWIKLFHFDLREEIIWFVFAWFATGVAQKPHFHGWLGTVERAELCLMWRSCLTIAISGQTRSQMQWSPRWYGIVAEFRSEGSIGEQFVCAAICSPHVLIPQEFIRDVALFLSLFVSSFRAHARGHCEGRKLEKFRALDIGNRSRTKLSKSLQQLTCIHVFRHA